MPTYIDLNPVRAGLTEEYRWYSCTPWAEELNAKTYKISDFALITLSLA